MKKSTKIITTAVALALVVAAMVVGIYAATSGSATITANVSWEATAGITFELTGSVAGGKTTPSAISHTVTASTSNTDAAALAGTLSTSFNDTKNDGVNNPDNIVFTYTVKNTGTTPIKVQLTKAPVSGAESGTTEATHKPTVAYEITGVTTTYDNIIQADKVTINSGVTLTVKITLSLASGTDAVTDADLGITSFDAGVTFKLTK